MPLSTRSLGAVLLVAACPGAAQAQRRALDADDPQARLMGYYAAVMYFSPIGPPPPSTRGEVGGELTLLPSLTEQERRVGFGGTKAEDTNFCPVLPRLRGALDVGPATVEAGYVPPVRACGVQAHLVALALARRVTLSPAWSAGLRLSAHGGALNAAITCGEDAVADSLDLTCFGGNVSDDDVRPLAFGLDALLGYTGWRGRRLEPYLLVGVRRERVGFDVNYTRSPAQALPGYPAFDDHERLEATLTRVHAALGASWVPAGRLVLGGELFYAPGALLTARGRAALALGRRP